MKIPSQPRSVNVRPPAPAPGPEEGLAGESGPLGDAAGAGYRIFSEARAISARIPDTIQKRTVILVSASPWYLKL